MPVIYQVGLSCGLHGPRTHQPDVHGQVLQDGDHVGVVKAQQLPPVDLQQLVAAV